MSKRPQTSSPRPKAHSKADHASKALVAASGSPLTPAQSASLEDSVLASLLREQYSRAVGGMREVLKFGAMLMKIRSLLEEREGGFGPRVDQNPPSPKGGRPRGGIREWLRVNCPDIAYSTAQRFLGIAEAVQGEYIALVGAKVAKSYALPDLVDADPRDLPDNVAKKQLELFTYVDGTSQRSWLDRFKATEPKGGPRKKSGGGDPDSDPDGPPTDPTAVAIELWKPLLEGLAEELRDGSWAHLPDTGTVSRETLHGLIVDLGDKLREANRKASRK